MHCHSNLSDGVLSPEDLAGRIADGGAVVAALTDHDTVEGSMRFREALSLRGVAFVDGVELTTFCEFGELHLLAYGIDIESEDLWATLSALGDDSDRELQGFIDQLRRLGTRPHAGRLETGAAIDLVHTYGGMAVLAHPLDIMNAAGELESILDYLVDRGLDGLEAIYAPYAVDCRHELIALAEARGLCVSIGSDFHAPDDPLHPAVMEVEESLWKDFRDRLLSRTERNRVAKPDEGRSGKTIAENETSSDLRPERAGFRLGKYSIRVIIASVAALSLFVIALFAVSIPYFEKTLLDRKKEMIRELTTEAVSLIAEYQAEESLGTSTRSQAQADAISHMRNLRYGREGKDYFWITDSAPRMLLHPYRTDLEGRDVADFKDDNGLRVFYELSRAVREESEGYVEYLWQWKDDADRIVPKLSFVKRFEPWDWIIGTGIYMDDVESEIGALADRMIWLSCLIAGILSLLLAYIAQQSLRMEKEKKGAEFSVRESKERYKALVEASTEGMAIIVDGTCTFANAPFLELSGYTEAEVVLMGLSEFLAPYEGEVDSLVSFFASLPKNDRAPRGTDRGSSNKEDKTATLACLFKKRNGEAVDVVVTTTAFALAGKNVAVLAVKEARLGRMDTPIPIHQGAESARTADLIGLGFFRARLNRRATITSADDVARRFMGLSERLLSERVSLGSLFRDRIEWDSFYAELVSVGSVIRKNVRLLKTADPAESPHILTEALITARLDDTRTQGETYFTAIIETPDLSRAEIEEMREAALVADAAAGRLHETIRMAEPTRIKTDESARRAAQKMSDKGTDALIVQESGGSDIGIITDADLRRRIIAEGKAADSPIGPAMTAPLVSLAVGATYAQASRVMAERGIGHVAVRDTAGSVVALIGRKDFAGMQADGFDSILAAIATAQDSAGIAALRRMAVARARRLASGGLRPKVLTFHLSAVNDAIIRRLIAFAMEEFGTAPAPFAFLALGSAGRSESLPASDQDNAIVYMPDRTAGRAEDGVEERTYFLKLGAFVCDALNEIGIPYCPGGVMAKNEKWCAPIDMWEAMFRSWISSPDAQELLAFGQGMDFRTVYGDESIAVRLKASLNGMLADAPGFFTHFARNALQRKTGNPFSGTIFQGAGGETDVDLKELSSQFVVYARLYALRERLGEMNTYARIEALEAKGILESSLARDCSDLYESLISMRLAVAGQTAKVPLKTFNAREEACVREAVVRASLIQKKIAFDFPGSSN